MLNYSVPISVPEARILTEIITNKHRKILVRWYIELPNPNEVPIKIRDRLSPLKSNQDFYVGYKKSWQIGVIHIHK